MRKLFEGLKQKQMHRCLDAKMHSQNNVKDYASKLSPRPQCHLSGRGLG